MHKLSLLIILLLVLATIITKIQIFTTNKANSNTGGNSAVNTVGNSDEYELNLKRIHTWSLICLIGISVIYLSGWTLTLALIALTCWALIELARLFNVTLNYKYYFLIISILVPLIFINKYYQVFQTVLFVLPIVVLILALSLSFKQTTKKQSHLKQSHLIQSHFIAMLMFCILAINSIDNIAQIKISKVDPRFLVLFLCFITAVNDIAQYVSGKLYGRFPLASKLSPKKTIEGALGGIVITGFIVGCVFTQLLSINFILAFIIGVVISILGILGDLCFSYYKRQANVKNSGQSLPGHGGLLDRIDSLMLTAPGFGFCLKLIS